MSATATEVQMPCEEEELEELASAPAARPAEDGRLGAEDGVQWLLEDRRRWTCACGEPYRISGSGRHRIYWRVGASLSDPVTDGCCDRCGAPLPGKHPHRRGDDGGGDGAGALPLARRRAARPAAGS